MGETELEEGEVFSHQKDDGSATDPDIALSYIGERVQNILGHFQKDFEGGISAENLGAKFGGYGSFLPAYQLSPVWSRPSSPPIVQNCTTHRPSSASAALQPSTRASFNDSSHKDVSIPSSVQCAEESASKFEVVKNCAQHCDQKTLKFQIEVPSGNLPVKKSAEIYSGLGLDVSPSSSLDESPMDSERFSHELLDVPNESPTSILQIITSYTIQGNSLLSPLHNDLIYLTGMEKLQGQSKPICIKKSDQECSNGSGSAWGDDKVLGSRRHKSSRKKASPLELKNNGTQNGNGLLSKKATEVNTSACKGPVDNALKLSDFNFVNFGKSTSGVVENSGVTNKVKKESFFLLAKVKSPEAVATQKIDLLDKPNKTGASADKVLENRNSDFHISVHPIKAANFEVNKADSKDKSNLSEGRKCQIAKLFDSLEENASNKNTLHEGADKKMTSGKESLSSRGKKKSKGSQNYGPQGAEVPKDISRLNSCLLSKNRKSNYPSTSEVEDSKLNKDHGKERYTYKDLSGDLELDLGGNDVDSAEMLSTDRQKDFEGVEKSTVLCRSTMKERLSGKKMDKTSTSKLYSKVDSGAAPSTGNKIMPGAVFGKVTPLVKEDWVCCDKCHKWRLFPSGTNPDSLPEKWICSMLNWLPRMNRYSISEEETTKALIAHYQVSAHQSQNKQHGYPDVFLPKLSLADARHLDRNCQNESHGMHSGKKKKTEIKDVSAALKQVGPSQFSNSVKDNLQASVTSRSLNVGKQSPPANETEPQHLSKPSFVEKRRCKQKQKNELREHHSDGGEIPPSTIRRKRENEPDCFRIAKKAKVDSMHCSDEYWMPDCVSILVKVDPGSTSGLSVKAFRKEWHHRGEHPFKDSMHVANGSSEGSLQILKNQDSVNSDDGSLHVEKTDGKEGKGARRKRTMNESLDTPIYTASQLSEHHCNDKRNFPEETNENGNETSTKKGSHGSFKHGRGANDQKLGPYMGSTLTQHAMDSLRSELGSVLSSQVATSSSSKVSGSHKNNSNLQEVKGSPVESVSSFPLKFSNPDQYVSRRSLERKDDSGAAGLLAIVRKHKLLIIHHDSLDSSAIECQEKNKNTRGLDAKLLNVHSPELAEWNFAKDGNEKQHHTIMSQPRNPGIGSSLWSKDNGPFKSELDKVEVKIYSSCNETYHTPYKEKSRDGKNSGQEKFVVCPDKVEKNSILQKESAGKLAGEKNKMETQSYLGEGDGLDGNINVISSQDLKQNGQPDHDERSLKRYHSNKTDQLQVSRRGKNFPSPLNGKGQNEAGTHVCHLVPGSKKENGANCMPVDASKRDDALKVPTFVRRSENQMGNQLIKSGHATTNGQRIRDMDASTPVRRDSSGQVATNAIKEVKDLKHLADRLKNSGSKAESTVLYFQAALKFLQAAFLLESCNSVSTKKGEMTPSMQIYKSTAKLFGFCALEYKQSKDMAAAAASAYKCMEVAYMRVIYYSNAYANRVRHELQRALEIVPPGESPSSSASDVDNLSNSVTLDKSSLPNVVSSPHISGNHVIASCNHPNMLWLLNFTQDVNFAMDASRKCRIAFMAAKPRMEGAQDRKGITCIKIALDFNFQDIEELLRLVRVAIEALSH
ncbi:hypothetical protein NMG60_11013861 [Bertholletia excelsa]